MKIDGTRRQDRAIELVLAYYAAFNRGDREAMLALLADDVAHDLNQGARETGKAAFDAFMKRMDASYREQLQDIVVLASQDGDRAAKACRPRAGRNTCCPAGRSSTSATTASRG
jgi:steroid delta-isomerase-like uncharacterized protein